MGKVGNDSSMVSSSTPPPPPKLSFYSLPGQRPDPPGTATPPNRLRVSVPFLWEEAPGKPRKQAGGIPGAVRSLELPPRMMAAAVAAEAKSANKTPSPTTVLDGPELGSCYSFSFGEGRTAVNSGGRKKEGMVWFWRRGSSGRKVVNTAANWQMVSSEGSEEKGVACSFVSSACKHGGDHEVGNVRITRLRRNRSLASVATPRIWASIYGSLKQVVPLPWRRDRKA